MLTQELLAFNYSQTATSAVLCCGNSCRVSDVRPLSDDLLPALVTVTESTHSKLLKYTASLREL